MATVERPLASRPFEHLVLDFLAYLEFERGLSRNTLEAYRSDLLQFGRFLEEREPQRARRPGRRSVADFLAALAGDGRAASPATVHRKAACLRSFYRHLRREERARATTPPPRSARPRRGKRAAPGAHARRGDASCSTSRGAPSRPRCATARCWS